MKATKRFQLIPDLENLELEEPLEVEEIDVPDDFDAAMIMVMEADDEVNEQLEEMDRTDEMTDEIESSLERLEVLAKIIHVDGISGPMMKAADPFRELVEAGVCTDYEQLGVEFVKDDFSEEVATTIDNVVASTEAAGALVIAGGTALAKTAAVGGAGIGALPIAAAAAAAVAIGTLVTIVAKSMATHKGALKSAQKQLEGLSFDEEKFKGMTKKVLSKEEFGRAIKGADLIIKAASSGNLIKIAEDIEGVVASGDMSKVTSVAKRAADSLKPLDNEDIKSIFGLDITLGEDGIQTVSNKAGVIKSKGNLGEKGWSAANAKDAVAAALRVTAEGEGLGKSLKTSAAQIKKISGSLKSRLKAEKIDKAVAKAALGQIKKTIDAYKTIVKAAIGSIYKINGTATQVAKAAVSSKAKAE